jgi:hypothetical protein
MKALMKLIIEGIYLNLIKAAYNSIANTIINGGKLKPCSLNSVRRQVCLFSSHLFSIVLEFLARTII